jgi:hypothetical protein
MGWGRMILTTTTTTGMYSRKEPCLSVDVVDTHTRKAPKSLMILFFVVVPILLSHHTLLLTCIRYVDWLDNNVDGDDDYYDFDSLSYIFYGTIKSIIPSHIPSAL